MQDDRYFGPANRQKKIARELYECIVEFPLICPHGHVNPRLFAEHGATFGSPDDLFIVDEEYSATIPCRSLGSKSVEGARLMCIILDAHYSYRKAEIIPSFQR